MCVVLCSSLQLFFWLLIFHSIDGIARNRLAASVEYTKLSRVLSQIYLSLIVLWTLGSWVHQIFIGFWLLNIYYSFTLWKILIDPEVLMFVCPYAYVSICVCIIQKDVNSKAWFCSCAGWQTLLLNPISKRCRFNLSVLKVFLDDDAYVCVSVTVLKSV